MAAVSASDAIENVLLMRGHSRELIPAQLISQEYFGRPCKYACCRSLEFLHYTMELKMK